MLRPVECPECHAGQTMCGTPCWGTPEDILRIIDGVGADKLMLVVFLTMRFELVEILVPANPGFEGRYAERDPAHVEKRRSGCAFQERTSGKCTVHAIKPTEGRLACCKRTADDLRPLELREFIATAWSSESGRALLDRWKRIQLKESILDKDVLLAETAQRMVAAWPSLSSTSFNRSI